MRDTNKHSMKEFLGPKQAQLITIQIELPDKGHAIKELDVCWVLLNVIPLGIWTEK